MRGKKPFKKRTKIEQERTRLNLHNHFIELSNHAKNVLKDDSAQSKKENKK